MFFKKKINFDTIKTTVESYVVDGMPIQSFVNKLTLTGDVLEIALSLPDNLDAERIHSELGQILQKHGVNELNMSVSLVKSDKVTPQTFSPNKPTPNNHTPSPTDTKPLAQDILTPHPRIRHIIAVASGKGGVGKSTTAVNLALALQKKGARVGMLDADIYGPSLPDMLGVAGVKPMVENGQFVPIDAFGMPMISIGSLLDGEHTPVAWRGIKAVGAMMQMYNDTAFPHLDYLIIDMPPGTGDIALSLAQKIPMTGAVIVTTPQHIALLDVKKGIELFNKTHIPVMGIIENMAMHTCTNCGHSEPIFGADGGQDIADRYGVPLLGQLPLASGIGRQMDKGEPSVVCDDEFAQYYLTIAQAIMDNIGQFAKKRDESRIF